MRLCLVALALLLTACPATPKAFPDGFLFGAAIAGFQADPGCPTLPASQCVDTHSDWYQWVTSEAELQDLKSLITFEPLANSAGFWELYAQDFDRAKDELGLDSVRLSIEWSRVFPSATDGLEGAALDAAADPAALAGYHAQFQAMKARGLKPLVTLHHYTLPLWIHDGVACHQSLSTCTEKGWLDQDRVVREIAKYAGFVGREFGGEVDLWATQNEPFAVVLPGYIFPSPDRVNPPGLSFKFAEARAVMQAMIEAHARMYDALKAGDTVDADGDGDAATVGLVYAMTPTKGKTDSRVDTRAAENLFYLYNTAFLDGVARGIVDFDLDGKPDTAEPRPDLANRLDYVGINFYTQTIVSGTGTASFPALSPLTTFDPTSLGLWGDYPKGIYEVEMHVKERYGLPIYITETGTDASMGGEKVERWLVRHLEWTKRAIAEGADVRGFYVWSLTDNYEWNHGMTLKFGLYEVAADAPKTRVARSAVPTYKAITSQRDVSAALLEKFPLE